MVKSSKGFTLVELIVVIAILGILAGVAVPAYSGYIAKANEASDYTQLDAIKTAVIFTATEDKLEDVDVTTITVTESAVTYVNVGTGANGANETVTLTTDDDFLTYAGYTSWDFEFKSDATQAVWSSATQTWTLSE